jgi:serine/threonine protein kinase
VVYKARDQRLDRFVALKILPSESLADNERKQRFIQEAKAVSALNHPGIITIHDVVHGGELDCIVMEFVEGRTLDQIVNEGPLPSFRALSYAIQIADALGTAHNAASSIAI